MISRKEKKLCFEKYTKGNETCNTYCKYDIFPFRMIGKKKVSEYESWQHGEKSEKSRGNESEFGDKRETDEGSNGSNSWGHKSREEEISFCSKEKSGLSGKNNPSPDNDGG